jgi:uncharacterized protein
MSKDLIRYDLLVQEALKGVVRKVLIDAGKDGLSGEHHFYISFRTDFTGVRLSNRLREKYPQEMTIVLQHQFWDLNVTDHTFEVGLSFSGVPERLLIPFDALTGFFDPSVQFGLKFEVENQAGESEAEPGPSQPARGAGSEPVELQPRKAPSVPVAAKSATPKIPAKGAAEKGAAEGEKAALKADKAAKPTKAKDKDDAAAAAGAEVVSLDAFRKKS